MQRFIHALCLKLKVGTGDAALTINSNSSLPSTAITAGMVHNIHKISIIGYLYRPDIQMKYVPIAIDSKGREGTGGPSPPIERCQIAEKPTQI